MGNQTTYTPDGGRYWGRNTEEDAKYIDDGLPVLSTSLKLNREQKVFIIRSSEIVLEAGGTLTHFLKITVPAKKKLIILDRYIQGTGLGSISLEVRGGTDAVSSPETAFSANVVVGVSLTQPDTEFEFTGSDIGGSAIEPHPSIGYLGDELAVPAIRTGVSNTIPIGYLERIITNNTDSSFNFGVEMLISSITASRFTGYFELFCKEEDLD